MPQIIAGVSGAHKQVKKVPIGVSGVNRECKEAWAGVSGVNKKVFESDISYNIKLCYWSAYDKALANIKSVPNNKRICNTDAAYIDESTGDIYIATRGCTEWIALKLAAVSTPIPITSVSVNLIGYRETVVVDGSSTWKGGSVESYFGSYKTIRLGGAGNNGANSYGGKQDLLGAVWRENSENKRVYYNYEDETFTYTPNLAMPTLYNIGAVASLSGDALANTVSLHGEDKNYTANIIMEAKIPNKSLIINGNPVNFLKCVRSAN